MSDSSTMYSMRIHMYRLLLISLIPISFVNTDIQHKHWHHHIIMSFYPAIQDLVNYHRADTRGLVIFLGHLDRNTPKADIENALQNIPECCGNVTVCWQSVLPQGRRRRRPQRQQLQNPGWCHILCTSLEVKNCLWDVLDNQRLIGSWRQTITVARAKEPIVRY